jgi:two-component system sensor histidine kinase QseC
MALPLRSLQGRLLALVLTLVAGVWGMAAVVTVADVRHELDELLDGHLAQAAALLVAQQTREIGDADPRDLDAPVLHRYAPRVAFQVFHEGRLVLRSANAPAQPLRATALADNPALQTVQIDGTAWRVFTAHGAERDVRVHVGEQLGSRAEILLAVQRGSLLPLLLTLPLLGLAVWWAVRQGLAPLRQLSRLLATRQPQATEALAVAGAPAELAPMVAALNGLFGRIAALLGSERRFTADAAHELRTPIAAIRTQAQVALTEADEAARQHALQAVLAGCDRASRLVTQMLTLARLEAGATPPRAPLNLAALVRQVVAELAPRALENHQVIEVEAAAPLTVQGDASLLEALVRNLVDNALRYSPPQALVQILVSAHSGGVRLRVQDSGPGLDEAQLERLGERFFRVLGSAQSGSGLGWSIVRRIAAVHGAAVAVGPSPALGGLEVTLDFPAPH